MGTIKGYRRKIIKGPRRVRERKDKPVTPVEDPLKNLLMTRYVETHLDWLLTTGYAMSTVVARRTALRRFVAWAYERGINDPREVTRPMLERYQRHLFYYRKPEDGSPMTIGSQLGYLAPLKTFFKWLVRQNHILYNPASELDLPRQPRALPRGILSIAEMETVLMQATGESVQSLRDRAIMEMLYSTGLRRHEIANLKLHDVDLIQRVVFVREGKGNKDRFVPIGERACAWVDKYLVESRSQLVGGACESLFVNDFGETLQAGSLSDRVGYYMRAAGLKRYGSTHLFRHTCATHMLENGADIRFIQAMLGHASLETTQIYTHVAISKLQEIHTATHPARLERQQRDNTTDIGETTSLQAKALLNALEAEGEAEIETDDADSETGGLRDNV